MSWGFMPPLSVICLTSCEREINLKQPDANTGTAIALISNPAPSSWPGTAGLYGGIKPGFPLGYEPDWTPQIGDPQSVRFDHPLRCIWPATVPTAMSAEPKGESQDSTPP